MLTKTQLKAIFERHGLAPLKRLGENYLIDGNIKEKIINEAHLKKTDTVLEIGPGLGALTIDLARTGATIYAVEKDRKVFSILSDLTGANFPNLRLICGDILDFDLDKACLSKKIKIIGNLPYYITTPIIEFIVNNRRLIEWAIVTVQKEFADRLVAAPGAKEYSSISCFAQYYMDIRYIYTVKRNSFYPIPSVDSSLIQLDLLSSPSVAVKDETLFFKIIRGAFNQRRKAITNSLSREEILAIPKEELSRILRSAKIDPAARPESLSLSDFAGIANALKQAESRL